MSFIHFLRGTNLPTRLLWLLIGALAIGFSNGGTANIFAAWLAPIFLLRFSRTTSPFIGFICLAIVNSVAFYIMFNGIIPMMPQAEFIVSSILSGLFIGLILLIDRMVSNRLPTLMGTLVFPSLMVGIPYLFSISAPFGTWANDAYVQLNFTPLIHLSAVTGIWGIGFLVNWLASALQPIWANAPDNKAPIFTYAIVFAAAIGFGFWNMSTPPEHGQTVKLAALTNPPSIADRFFSHCENGDLACRTRNSDSRHETLFTMSAEAVERGAKIILWYEGAAQYDAAYENNFITQAKTFAAENAVYLLVGAAKEAELPEGLIENKAMMFTPKGTLAWEYLKSIPVPGEPIVKGDGELKTIDTEYGRLSAMICFDADFPDLAQQASAKKVNLLLIPANDWREITPIHADMTIFRAIENGINLVRATSNGMSLAATANGQVLARNDVFSGNSNIMYVDMPTATKATIYSQWGDYFAWLCLGGFLILAMLAWFRRKLEPAS